MSARMTAEQVARIVATIASVAGDFEIAHSSEDDMHQSVLHEIAMHSDDAWARAVAAAALESLQIDFPRYCA